MGLFCCKMFGCKLVLLEVVLGGVLCVIFCYVVDWDVYFVGFVGEVFLDVGFGEDDDVDW